LEHQLIDISQGFFEIFSGYVLGGFLDDEGGEVGSEDCCFEETGLGFGLFVVDPFVKEFGSIGFVIN
jgi:hypothetical protein